MNDLKDSDINISENDVVLKSKPEANLCSYKISVPAVDLDKALDPQIWPLRVKVREYVYYSNKPKKQNDQNQSQTGSDGNANAPNISVPQPRLGSVSTPPL